MDEKRRKFLKIAAGLGAGAAVGTILSPIPWKLVDDISIWTQNWPWLPRLQHGEFKRINTVSSLSPSKEAIEVLSVAGRPVTIRGNSNNLLNSHSASPLALAEAYALYSPARIKEPLLKANGKFQPISWEKANSLLIEKVKSSRDRLAFISGDFTGTANEVFSAFIRKCGSKNYFFMPGEVQSAGLAWKKMGGKGLPGYDVENSDLVLLLEAEMLGASPVSTYYKRILLKKEQPGHRRTKKIIYAGPSVAQETAAAASLCIPCIPGTSALIALAVAGLLIQRGKASIKNPEFEDFWDLVRDDFLPEKVARASRVPVEKMENLATLLAEAKQPLIIPGAAGGFGVCSANFVAGMSLNLLLDRMGVPGGVSSAPAPELTIPDALSFAEIMDNDLAGFFNGVVAAQKTDLQTIFVYGANPLYSLPLPGVVRKVFSLVPFKVSFSSLMDETAAACDLVLPVPMALESHGDAWMNYGLPFQEYRRHRPVISSVVNSRPAPDVILALAKALNLDLGFASFPEVLSEKAKSIGKEENGFWLRGKENPARAKGTESLSFVEHNLLSGLTWRMENENTPELFGFANKIIAQLKPFETAANPEELDLVPLVSWRTGTPESGILPHNLSLLRSNELRGRYSCAWLNTATAKKHFVKENDLIELYSPQSEEGRVRLRVHINESIADDSIGVLFGLGHTAFDGYSQNKGINIMNIVTAKKDLGTGFINWSKSKVRLARL